MTTDFSCFKAYDIRGKIGVEFNSDIAYRIARAVVLHLNAETVVIGRDPRESSTEIGGAVSQAVVDSGGRVLDIGLVGTEEVYWAVNSYGACSGIMVTASHNPSQYNGLKIVKSFSRPLDINGDMEPIKFLFKKGAWPTNNYVTGIKTDVHKDARKRYLKKVFSIAKLKKTKSLRVVFNCGHGSAGPVISAIEKYFNKNNYRVTFIKINDKPDGTFPTGVPNPLLEENQKVTGQAVRLHKADLGIAFDADFDRCFFFDENGNFVSSEYILGIFAEAIFNRRPNESIVCDRRLIWNIQDITSTQGGNIVYSKTGHTFFKEKMFEAGAVFGGELSGHYYYRDFANCDSGMIPWLQLISLLSEKACPLSELVSPRIKKFPSIGEINFLVNDPVKCLRLVKAHYAQNIMIDEIDGLTCDFKKWRFNLRVSKTENYLRLNMEAQGIEVNLEDKVQDLTNLICNDK